MTHEETCQIREGTFWVFALCDQTRNTTQALQPPACIFVLLCRSLWYTHLDPLLLHFTNLCCLYTVFSSPFCLLEFPTSSSFLTWTDHIIARASTWLRLALKPIYWHLYPSIFSLLCEEPVSLFLCPLVSAMNLPSLGLAPRWHLKKNIITYLLPLVFPNLGSRLVFIISTLF